MNTRTALPARIERLWFRDFRGLSNVDFVLPEARLAVLVGANGAGKTSRSRRTAKNALYSETTHGGRSCEQYTRSR